MQLVEKRPGLLIRHVLEAALEDAATERMGREVVHTSAERSNEVESFGSHTLDELLDDMVAVGIEHTLERVALELLNKRRLLLGRDVLNRLLHNAAAVLMNRQHMSLTFENIDGESNVVGRNTLDCFLHNMVAILIFDQLEDI